MTETKDYTRYFSGVSTGISLFNIYIYLFPETTAKYFAIPKKLECTRGVTLPGHGNFILPPIREVAGRCEENRDINYSSSPEESKMYVQHHR